MQDRNQLTIAQMEEKAKEIWAHRWQSELASALGKDTSTIRKWRDLPSGLVPKSESLAIRSIFEKYAGAKTLPQASHREILILLARAADIQEKQTVNYWINQIESGLEVTFFFKKKGTFVLREKNGYNGIESVVEALNVIQGRVENENDPDVYVSSWS